MSIPPVDPAQVIDAMHAAFRVRDLDAIAEHWAADVVYEAPGVQLRGRAARKLDEKIWLDAFSDNTVEVRTRYVVGDEVIDFCVMGGLHTGELALAGGGVLPPTGRRVSGRYVALYRVTDGQVVHQQVFYDRLGLVEQLHGKA